MTNEDIRKLQSQAPFRPYDIHLVDGRILHVPHSEFLFIPPCSVRTVIVAHGKGSFDIVNTTVIVSIRES